MPSQFCHICGYRDVKLHSFPRNLERLRKWQEAMNYKFSEELARSLKICTRHFPPECYTNAATFELRKDAVPSLFPCTTRMVEEAQPSTSEVSEPILETTPISEKCEVQHTYQTVSEAVSPSSSMVRDISTQPQTPPDQCGSRFRKSLFRNIEGLTVASSTPRKKALIGIIKKREEHIRKLKSICKTRGKNIKDLFRMDIHNSDLVKDIFTWMSSSTVTLMLAQMRCANRHTKGRRWTMEEKTLSLALYKRSPKCYSLLYKLMALPSKSTLNTLLRKIPFEAGINNHIFLHLGECLKNYKDEDRFCTLMFDEMAIRGHLQYNHGSIVGVEDLGNGRRTNKIAYHALVFMAQGIRKSWKQPLAFYFTNKGITSEQLEPILKDVLDAMYNANLTVVATVCDMGGANVKTLKNMGSTVLRPYFIHGGRKVFNLFDFPHLLKCIRNLFRKYPVSLLVPIEGGQMLEARWSDIITAYETDQTAPTPFKSLVKIKPTHLAPTMQLAMKVKLAAQVMSHTVSAYLYTLLSRGILPQRALATATFVSQVDEIFDSVNGSGHVPPDGKPLRCVATETSAHMAFWKNAYQIIREWNIIRKPTDIIQPGPKPPSQVGWMQSLQAMRYIWDSLKHKLKYLRPRSFNQDPLENLFGSVRASCGCNENPTVEQFIGALKTQIINGLARYDIQEGTGNCENDDGTLLSNLHSFLTSSVEPITLTPTDDSITYVSKIAEDIANSVSVGKVESLSMAYVSGYIAKRLLRDISCQICIDLLQADSDLPCNQFIHFKEYSEESQKLLYPSENLVITVGHGITILEDNLPYLCSEARLDETCIDKLSEVLNFSWITCTDHFTVIKNSIMTALCKIGIPWYCKRIVRSLKEDSSKKRKLKKLKNQ